MDWVFFWRASPIGVLYLTYGVIGGAGLGLGNIVPVATLVKWFPDRRGFITGIAVARWLDARRLEVCRSRE